MNYKRLGKSEECVSSRGPEAPCRKSDKFCVGLKDTNFVYKLPDLCNKNYDIAFMIDSSGSVSKRNYRKSLDFVARVVGELKVSKRKTHVAAMHFATSNKVDIKFTDKISSRKGRVMRAIRRIPKYRRGYTHTKKALLKAANQLFCGKKCGTRKNVKKVLVVLTDGKSNDKGVLAKRSYASVKKALEKQNVRVIAVGIDNGVNHKELNQIATKTVRTLKNGRRKNFHDTMRFKFRDLRRNLKRMVRRICRA